MKLIAALILSLSCLCAHAQGVRVKAERHEPNATITSWGTGCFVGKRHVLTAYHVIDSGALYAEVAGEWRKCKLIRADKKHDLALLDCTAESDDVVKLAQPELIYGSFSDESGPVENRDLTATGGDVKGNVRHGNSGGPVLNRKGELLGVFVAKDAQDERAGRFVGVEVVRSFLGEQK